METPKTISQRIEEAVRELVKTKPNGFTQKDVAELVPNVKTQTIAAQLSKCFLAHQAERLGKGVYGAFPDKRPSVIRTAMPKTYVPPGTPTTGKADVDMRYLLDGPDGPMPAREAESVGSIISAAENKINQLFEEHSVTKTSRAMPEGPMPANKDDAIEWLLAYVENLEAQNQDLYRQLCVTNGQQKRADAVRQRWMNRFNKETNKDA